MELLQQFQANHDDLIHDLQYNFYGNKLAICSADQKLKVFNKSEDAGWTTNDSWKAHDSAVLKVCWAHPEFGQVLASCSFDRTVKIWEEIETEQQKSGRRWAERAKLGHAKATVQDLQFAPNNLGLKIAACSADGILRIYEAIDPMNLTNWTMTDDFEIVNSASKEPDAQFCLSWCPSRMQPQMLAIGCGKEHVAKVFRLDAYNHWQSFEIMNGHGGIIRDIAWAPNMGRSYQLIATACSDGIVRIFHLTPIPSTLGKPIASKNLYTVELVAEFSHHQSEVWRVEWNVTGTILSSSGDDGMENDCISRCDKVIQSKIEESPIANNNSMQNIRRSLLSLSHNEPAIKILLEEDKDSIAALTKLGKEIGESASYLKKYGETQHSDLKDITEHLSFVSKHVEKSLSDLAGQLSKYRDSLKAIKKMSDELYELQVKAKSASDKLKKAQYQQKPLLRDLEEAEANLLQYEASYESSKRSLLKQGFLDEFQGYQEMGLKMQTIGHFGKELAKQIPQGSLGPGDEMPVYIGAATTRKIREDFSVAFENSPISRPASRTELSPIHHTPAAMASSGSPNLLPTHPGIYQQAPFTILSPPSRESNAAQPSTIRSAYIYQGENSNRSLHSSQTQPPPPPPTVSSCPYCNQYVLLPDMNLHIESKCSAYMVR